MIILHDKDGNEISVDADEVSEYSEFPTRFTNSEVRLNNGTILYVRENMVQIQYLLENAWDVTDGTGKSD